MALLAAVLVVGCPGRPERAEAPPATTGYAAAVEPPVGPEPEVETAPESYVADRMAVHAQQHAYDLVPASFMESGELGEGQEESFQTVLEAGRCYRILAVGGPRLTDLDLSVRDENGALVAEDEAPDATAVIGAGTDMLCPRWTGPFEVVARASRGFGEYGLQIFRTP